MSVTNYLDAKKSGDVLNDTLTHAAFSAYLQAESELIGPDGLLNKSKLKEAPHRKTFSSKVYASLVGFALSYFGATTTDDVRQEQLAFGLFGMNTPTIQKFVDAAEDKANVMGFDRYSQESTAFGYFKKQNSTERPKTKLEDADAEEVVTLTKTAGLVDPKRLTIDDMVELVTEYQDKGAILPNSLKGKHYII